MTHHDQRFFEIGLQYFAAGRWAAFCHFMPVAGNLLHHAVEMLLKARLTRTVSMKDLKKKYSHGLPKLWDAFKADIGDPALDAHDAAVEVLDRYDKIRYPDEWANGLVVSVCFDDMPPRIDKHYMGTAADGSDIVWERQTEDEPSPVDEYPLMVHEVDALTRAIIELVGFNLAAFPISYREDVREIINRDNRSPLKWKSRENA